jgi:hypothetical protein
VSVGGKWYEDTWPNPWVPRVTHYLVIWLCKIMGVRGVRPPDLPHTTPSHNRPTNGATHGSCYICICFIFVYCIVYWAGGRAGA